MLKPTIGHLKFDLLCNELKIVRWQAIGVLESLWIFAQYHAIDGDITKHGAHSLAVWMGWEGEPIALVEALVSSGWVDRTGDGRLLIHDWLNHCPNWVKGSLKSTLGDHNPNKAKRNAKRTAKRTLSSNLSGTLKGKERKGNTTKKEEWSTHFETFWDSYPVRTTPGGSRTKGNCEKAEEEFSKLTKPQRAQVLLAVAIYAKSGQKPRDAFRWLHDGDWRQWLPDSQSPNRTAGPVPVKNDCDLTDIQDGDDAAPKLKLVSEAAS